MSTTALINRTARQWNALQSSMTSIVKDMQSQIDGIPSDEASDVNASRFGDVAAGMATLDRLLKEAREAARAEMDSEKRYQTQTRVQSLTTDYNQLRQLYDKTKKSFTQMTSERQRSELFSRPGGSSAAPVEQIGFDQALKENRSLNEVGSQLDTFINLGFTTLEDLRRQRMTFKGAHRRLLDAANTLGLSQSVIRVIEMRTKQDQYIFFGGVFVTLLIMYFTLRYLV